MRAQRGPLHTDTRNTELMRTQRERPPKFGSLVRTLGAL